MRAAHELPGARKPARAASSVAELVAIVVLGCRPIWSPDGRLHGALGRRVAVAAARFRGHAADPDHAPRVLATGGRLWDGALEADAMRDALVRSGVPEEFVVRERCALTTADNARFSASILHRLGLIRVTLVTCDWHLPRAVALFESVGVTVQALPVPSPRVTTVARWARSSHEWVSSRIMRTSEVPA